MKLQVSIKVEFFFAAHNTDETLKLNRKFMYSQQKKLQRKDQF